MLQIRLPNVHVCAPNRASSIRARGSISTSGPMKTARSTLFRQWGSRARPDLRLSVVPLADRSRSSLRCVDLGTRDQRRHQLGSGSADEEGEEGEQSSSSGAPVAAGERWPEHGLPYEPRLELRTGGRRRGWFQLRRELRRQPGQRGVRRPQNQHRNQQGQIAEPKSGTPAAAAPLATRGGLGQAATRTMSQDSTG